MTLVELTKKNNVIDKQSVGLLQYVVIPTRRSTAEAFQILFAHALGDAGSPYLIGVVSIVIYLFCLVL